MKTYHLLSLVILTGCASSPRVIKMPPPISGTTFSPSQAESVRYPESVKAYPVGRYIDPNNSDVMHEQHTIYRVETSTRWNLHPSGPAAEPFGPPVAVIDSAHRTAPVNAEVIAEVNKQKTATQALLDETAKLNQSVSQFAGAFQVMDQVQQQNLQLRQELSTSEKRIAAVEEELQKKQTDPFESTTNQNTTNQW